MDPTGGRSAGKFSYEREDAQIPPHDDDRDGECAVFVTDIARGVSDEMLRDKFRDYGTVTHAFVVKNKFTGDTKGYGFVHFAEMEAVYRVLDAKELPRFEDSVSHKIQMVKATMADPKDTLLIINIPRGWEEADIVKSLTDVSSEAPRKFRFSGTSKATAYTSYMDHAQALRVLKCIQRPPNGVPPPPFTAYLAPPRFFDAKNAPSMKVLFVRGTAGMSSEVLRKLFGGPDVVEKAVVPTDSARGSPIGHAFIHFYSTKAAAEAKEAHNSREFDGNRLTVEWCLPKTVTHKKSPAVSSVPGHPAYPPYYPPYPYSAYPEYDPYYPPPPPPGYGYPNYDSYGHGGYEQPAHRVDRRSDPNPYPRGGQYPPQGYPAPAHNAYPSHYPKSSPPYRPSSPHSRPHHAPSSYPPSDRNSRGSAYPPSSASAYSSRSNRYVPY